MQAMTGRRQRVMKVMLCGVDEELGWKVHAVLLVVDRNSANLSQGMFHALDTSGDGTITLEEFAKGCEP